MMGLSGNIPILHEEPHQLRQFIMEIKIQA